MKRGLLLLWLFCLFSITPNWSGESESWRTFPDPGCLHEADYGDMRIRQPMDCRDVPTAEQLIENFRQRTGCWTCRNCPLCWLDYL